METMPPQHLDNDALLLAYLAGELPAEERARIAEMLAVDAALSARLDDLRGAFTGVEDALRSADAAEPLALSAAAASRRFGREVRAWQTPGGARTDVLDREQPSSRRRLRIPGWVYPAATAAAVLLGYTIWWRANPDTQQFAFLRSRPGANQMPDNLDYPAVPPTALADGYAFDIGAWTTPNALLDREEAATESVLSDTEAELYALSGPGGGGDDDDVPTSLLLGELE